MGGASDAHWSAEDWCDALGARFFGSHSAQLPVLFFIDEDVLSDLHPSGDKAVAVESLSRSVRSGLVQPQPNGYFAGFERQGRRWKLAGGDGRPPFLHVLALCVLAATRMGTGKVAPTNYRHQLCALLGLDDGEMPICFRESLYYLWDALTWWLDVRNGGALGISTVVEDKRFTHIGYPDPPDICGPITISTEFGHVTAAAWQNRANSRKIHTNFGTLGSHIQEVAGSSPASSIEAPIRRPSGGRPAGCARPLQRAAATNCELRPRRRACGRALTPSASTRSSASWAAPRPPCTSPAVRPPYRFPAIDRHRSAPA